VRFILNALEKFKKDDFLKKFLRAVSSILLAMFLFAGLFFSDCKNFPLSLGMLPDPEAAWAFIFGSFLAAGALIIAIWQYFNVCKKNSNSYVIERSKAMAFLVGLALYVVVLIDLVGAYCK
jgi:hypothetical protein